MKMYRDNYTNFTFDELPSESFKVWITNKNDLKRNMSPNFSDKFNTPTYGQIRYHEGTTIDKQDFKLSCVAVDVTLTEWKAISEWLSPLKSGKLMFDWNDKYYYMVKVSKAISGTMFVKSTFDSTMGQLYIITFDIEFTTVSDWAAIGPYCQLFNTELPNISIFNNSYCIPQIIIRDLDGVEKTMNHQSTIYGGGYIDICYDISGCLGVQKDNTVVYNEFTIKELQSGNLVDVASVRYQRAGVGTQCVYYYYDTNKTLSWSFAVPSRIENDKTWYRIYLGEKQCAVQDEVCPIEYVRYYDNNLILANPSAYTAYPILHMNGAVNIIDNNDTIVSYAINEGAYSTTSTHVILDNQAMTLTNGGRSIVSVTDSYGTPVFKNIRHVKQMVSPSGRPEMIKAKFIGTHTLKDDDPTYTGPEVVTFTFQLRDKPAYDRYQPFLLHIFKQDFSKDVNIFNKTEYSTKEYYKSIYDIDLTKQQLQDAYKHSTHRFLLNTPDIKVRRVDGNYFMDVTCFQEAPDTMRIKVKVANPIDVFEKVPLTIGYADNPMEVHLVPGAEFEEDDIVYLSFCDYTGYTINTVGEQEFAVGIYPRDVI